MWLTNSGRLLPKGVSEIEEEEVTNKLTETPFKHVRPRRPMGHTRRSWIRETLGKGKGHKTHSNASLLRLLNRQYREIESLKEKSQKRLNKMCDLADEIESLKAQRPQWISVDERFPKEADGMWVMVRDDRGQYNYIEARFVFPNSDEITHWMPIPTLEELTNAK